MRAKKLADAEVLAEELIGKAIARGDASGLRAISAALRDDAARGNAELTAQVMASALASYQLDQANLAGMLNLLEAYAFAGDETKVKELAPRRWRWRKTAVRGKKDAYGTLAVAAAYFAAGNKEQAKSTAEKAIKMVGPANAGMLGYVEKQAKKYGVGAGKYGGKSDR